MKVVLIVMGVVAALYVLLCGVLYYKQEKLLFGPTVLPAGYRFRFPGRFEERWTTAADGTRLHGLLFRAPESKGLVFYLHSNGGALDSWGDVAATYTALGYDVFLPDYRGYGKSGGASAAKPSCWPTSTLCTGSCCPSTPKAARLFWVTRSAPGRLPGWWPATTLGG